MINNLAQIEQLIQQAVVNVCSSMLSMDVAVEEATPLALDAEGQIIGSVGFIGRTSGIIYLYAGVGFAKILTGRMLGLEPNEVDGGDMVNDVMGELSNMVAGYVKSRLCDSGWQCTLTIPSVVRGQQMSIEGSADVQRRVIGFRDGANHMVAEVLLQNPEA